ncbi:hypothetical protein AAFF_G00068490 [Aldrovandia affinis]|uniref:C2H2-type domain-containing protein n=1 Tax=Aldrovandia affinis TaxID=143900 RepID=A0AAD7RZD0_9TELE|nr:hypothetical protein AAFF_G00068490 [Aldrovandia affinis]
MSELQKLLSSTASSPSAVSSAPGMSAGIADCEPTPQPQGATNTPGTHLTCSFYGCKQAFSSMEQLTSHIQSHQIPTQCLPGKGFCCSSLGCNGTFPSMQHLMEHMRHHYKPNRYFLCESCRAKLRSYRALFKHLHTCAKVAKSKAARADEFNPPVSMTVMEAAEFASVAAPFQSPMKEEPMELEPAPLATDPAPLATNPAPSATDPAPLATVIAPLATESSPLSTAQPLASLQASRPARPAPPTPPAPLTPPGSNAVWKKNQDARGPLMPRGNSGPRRQSISAGQSFSSRILWEHTRGRYSCLQCGHSTPTRQEMTAHIEGQHRSPAGRPQNDMDIRAGSLPFQPKASLDTETAVYTQL